MKALLDTHAFLWWITDDNELSPHARNIISDRNTELFLSVASGWEIAIKAGLEKIQIPHHNILSFITEQLAFNAITPLPVQMNHACHTANLPLHHRDPFDRLLIAQAQLENLPIITADSLFKEYDVTLIW
ncbi:type II toxin-antitoxin system VapC family toxin [Dethiobacter alkaliphilus]|uniref:PilT protein domain protein n=1 Tax=Dethiobacter alkaliphilus AHT 1 TaxID=555088 RepID=C0GKQ3_DETAL|nr:type II toxin-antitoxin system VapC family toxin [Dethiobacter alkaliphilus]EEG76075.1 PilT protein domain protein [Dethiobacter alkaliphilus AHT 1]MCW3489786.1 type II toxin-antitoxin system VapC family toxin [Dethiobacter alkaliphilus]